MTEEVKKTKGFSWLKLTLFIVIVVLISGVALYSFMDINPADILVDGVSGLYGRIFAAGAAELNETVKTIFTYDLSEKLSFAAVSNDLVIASVSWVKRIDSEGREKAYIPVNLKNPLVQAYGEDILVSDVKGRYFALIYEGRIVWEKNIDEDIENASISDGWVILITKSRESGYKRTIRAYSREGQEISLRNVSNYYPYAVAHYPEFSKTTFVVSGVEASGLETCGIFEFLDPSMNQLASIRGEKEVYSKGFPLEKERLMLYGERSLMVLDQQYKTLWEKKMQGNVITGANVIQKRFPVTAELNTEVLARERRHESTVRIYNANGTEKKTLLIDREISGISSKGRTAALKAGSEVFFINADGEISDRFTYKSDISEVCLAKEDLAYMMTPGAIIRVKVKLSDKFLGIF